MTSEELELKEGANEDDGQHEVLEEGTLEGEESLQEESEDESAEADGEEGEPEVVEESGEDEEVESLDEKLSAVFKDRVFESPEEKDKALVSYINALESFVGQAKQANDVLNERVEEDPEFGDFIRSIVLDGDSFRIAIAKHYTPSDLFPEEGDIDFEEYKKIQKERKKKESELKVLAKQIEENKQVSSNAITEFTTENSLSQEEAVEFFKVVDNLFNDFSQFKISKENLTRLYKSFKFEDAVKSAEKKGEVKGRNQKIEAKKAEEAKKGDGLPKVAPSASKEEPTPEEPKRVNPWARAAAQYQSRYLNN